MTHLEDSQRALIIASCANPVPDSIVSQYSKRVVRISDHQVVKLGPDTTKEEFENQRLAYELVDSEKVRIPRVYDFFCHQRGWVYIVMWILLVERSLIHWKTLTPYRGLRAC